MKKIMLLEEVVGVGGDCLERIMVKYFMKNRKRAHPQTKYFTKFIYMPIHIKLTTQFTPQFHKFNLEIYQSFSQACYQSSLHPDLITTDSNHLIAYLTLSEYQLIHSAIAYTLHISEKLIYSKLLLPGLLFQFSKPFLIESISNSELEDILNNSSQSPWSLAS